MDSTPVIIGLGLQTAVGLGLLANVAAVRSGLNAFRMSEYLRGYKAAERLKVSWLSTLSAELPAGERMRVMACAAGLEALTDLRRAQPAGNVPKLAVLLAVPATRPGFGAEDGQRLFREIVTMLQLPFDPAISSIVNTGHDGGLAALDYAARLIRAGSVQLCLVGGVDSYQNIDTLHWLEAQERLKLDEQPNGFIPGEGAAFVLLCARGQAEHLGLTLCCRGRCDGAGRRAAALLYRFAEPWRGIDAGAAGGAGLSALPAAEDCSNVQRPERRDLARGGVGLRFRPDRGAARLADPDAAPGGVLG